MKKIICLASLFCTFTIFAQINVDVLNGTTPETVCFLYGSPGNPKTLDGIECGSSKIGNVKSQKLDKYSTLHYLAHWTTGKIWTLGGSFVNNNNTTVFVLVRK